MHARILCRDTHFLFNSVHPARQPATTESNRKQHSHNPTVRYSSVVGRQARLRLLAPEFGVEKERNGAKNVIDWRTK